jgi:hypothetical protein
MPAFSRERAGCGEPGRPGPRNWKHAYDQGKPDFMTAIKNPRETGNRECPSHAALACRNSLAAAPAP